jgi:hypothetical protein
MLTMAQTILTHPTEPELTARVHENLYELFRSMGVLPGYELIETNKLCYHHAFPTNPMFKGAWSTRLAPNEVEGAIDEAIAWFDQRGAPHFFWWIDPQTQPADMTKRLIRRGFDGNMIGDPGMVADLHALNEDVQVPDGFTIDHAIGQKTLAHWRDVFAASYNAPASAGQAWVDATIYAGLEKAPWKMYVGYLNGKPVATSILFNGAGVAGVYGVGTLPEARRQGIGAAITVKPLLDARKQGYNYAVLFSSQIGYPVYQWLGFREVESKIGIFILDID